MATSTKEGSRFQLDLARYELRIDQRSVHLERQPMELLILLVERRGELVTREEIAARLWNKEVFVDADQSINRCVRKLRLVLNDDSDDPRFLETVVGKGYRFIGPIDVLGRTSRSSPEVLPSSSLAASSRFRPAYWLYPGLLAAVLVVSAAVWRMHSHKISAPAARTIGSIAVLPLQNDSGDPAQEYFADGMTQALTTDIAKISGLRVISHTTVLHYRGSTKTLPEIAAELRVDAVVEGSVVRQGGRVRVTAQLVDAATDHHLWAETYERSAPDVLGLQDEVARAIARQVKSRLSPADAAPALHSQDPQAQDAYLKGLHEADTYSRDGLEKSVTHFEEAVRRDPGFAEAWAGLSSDYSLLALFHYAPVAASAAKAELAARKAVELDGNLSAAHAALGAVLLKQWSYAAAEKELRRSVALDPSNSGAHQTLGYLYAGVLRRFDEGIQEMRRALDLDPLSPSKRNALGAAFYWAGRYDEALQVFREVPDGDANTERRHRRMAEIYRRKGMQPESIAEMVRALQLTRRLSLAAEVQQAYRSAGFEAARKTFFPGDLRERLPRIKQGDARGEVLWVAADYALLGDNDNAFRWLDRAFALNEEPLMYVSVEGHFESLRADPRFAGVLRRARLP